MKDKKKSTNGTVKMTDFVEKVSEVNETKQYDLFCFVKGNRTINQGHVNKLVAKIKRKNLMIDLEPIQQYETHDNYFRETRHTTINFERPDTTESNHTT